jgi:hypothetical protein
VGLALEGFEGNGERLNELALHFGEAAAVGEADRAVKYARSAADHAMAKHAYAQAAAHYARARASLQLSGSQQPELDCDLRLAHAAALYRSGGDDYRKAAFEAAGAARAIGDSQRLADAALLLVHYGPANPVIDPREVALLRDALGGLEDKGDRPARARLLAGLGTALSLLGEERAVALSRQAVDMARRLGDPMVLARVLASHHAAIAGPDVGEERVAVARELVMLGEQLGDPETTFAGHLASYVSLIAVSDIDGANAALELGDRLARELRQPAFAFHILRIRTAQALLAGRVGDGERLTAAMIRKGQEAGIRDSTLAAMSIGLEFIGRELSGRLHELERRISRLAASRPQWLLLQTALAQIQCQNGRPTRARQLLRRLGADGFHGIPRDELWFETIIHLAACAVHLPDRGAAAALYDILAPYAGRNTFTGMGSFGPADLTLALLAASLERCAEAERHFAAAADHCERLRAQGWAAHARHGWARMLMAQASAADHDRGRELAARALADADELGLTGLAGQLRTLLDGH